MFREGLGFALAVCFLTVSAAAQDGDSPSNEASDHIAAARLLEGEKDTIVDALVEWELAWESSGSLEEKDRREILEAMERLRAQTSSSGKKGERPPVWNVLHVAVPSVNVIDNQSYYGDFYGSTTHYNFKVDPNALRAVKKGFEAALDRLNVATKGRISFKGDFITLRKPIKKLDRIRDRSFWLSPKNLTEAAPQWSNGKYQIVIASLINPTEDKENFNFTQEWISRPGAESVGYVNMLWYPLDAIDNALRGERELLALYELFQNAILKGGGYPACLLPDSTSEAEMNDPDFSPPDNSDRASFPLHLLECHVTKRMWDRACFSPLPSTEFVKTWRLSRPIPVKGDGDPLEQDVLSNEAAVREMPRWRIARANNDRLTLQREFGDGGEGAALAFAGFYLHTRKECDVTLWIGADDGYEVILNGEPLARFPDKMDQATKDNERIFLPLEKGANSLLVKIKKENSNWSIVARICDKRGKAPQGVTVSTAPK